MTVSAYYTKFKTLWDELSNLTHIPKCTCNCKYGAMKLQETNDEAMKVTQFLMGLTDNFTNIRGQLLMMTPLPTLNQALALLQQEEKQRNFSSSVVLAPESAALFTKFSGTSGPSHSNSGNFGPYKGFSKPFSGNKRTNTRGTKKGSMECTYCHGTNHTRNRCFHLNGFPKNKKHQSLMDGKTIAQVMHQNSTNSSHSHDNNITSGGTSSVEHVSNVPVNPGILHSSSGPSPSSPASATLTPAQYQQLMSLLSQGMQNPSTNGASSSTYSNLTLSGISNFLSINTICLSTHTYDLEWILDSGASDHITSSYDLLENPVSLNSTIFLPNGHSALITHKGSITLTPNIVLKDVFYAPTFKFHLISISKLTKDTQLCISFVPNLCVF